MIVVLGGIKGGSGKSTIATNMAVIRSLAGADVILVDADEQRTSTIFTEFRNERRKNGAGFATARITGKSLISELKGLREKYDDVIIDVGGHDTTSQRTAMVMADKYIVPFAPRSFDMWTIENVAELVDQAQAINPDMMAYTFINKADSRGSDNMDSAIAMQEFLQFNFLPVTVFNRKGYADAGACGMSVIEQYPFNEKAVNEILNLYRHVFEASNTELDEISSRVGRFILGETIENSVQLNQSSEQRKINYRFNPKMFDISIMALSEDRLGEIEKTSAGIEVKQTPPVFAEREQAAATTM